MLYVCLLLLSTCCMFVAAIYALYVCLLAAIYMLYVCLLLLSTCCMFICCCYRTHPLLGAHAYVSTGRKWVLNTE